MSKKKIIHLEVTCCKECPYMRTHSLPTRNTLKRTCGYGYLNMDVDSFELNNYNLRYIDRRCPL